MRVAIRIEDIRKRRNGRPLSTNMFLKQGHLYKRRAWVAKISWGFNGIEREFLNPARNYQNSNGPGSRGIFLYYWLPDGIYEISAPINWKKVDRYFCMVKNNKLERIDMYAVARLCREFENA